MDVWNLVRFTGSALTLAAAAGFTTVGLRGARARRSGARSAVAAGVCGLVGMIWPLSLEFAAVRAVLGSVVPAPFEDWRVTLLFFAAPTAAASLAACAVARAWRTHPGGRR